ncbi:MAG: DUF4853 domain-containing protein [Peptidiphaga sp.]|jgi:lipoprotein|uniref:DUF4853 domain-containing protein n=1 Tax=Peptidiphaga sp. TaxID=2848648 RepID=UPI003616FA20
MKFCRKICSITLCLIIISCSSISRNEKHRQIGDGTKELRKRQTIEEYKRNTLPRIEKFLTKLSLAGAGELVYEESDYDETCGENKEGKNYLSANIKGRSIDVNKVIKYGNDILKPAGFSKRTERKYDNGDIVLYWLNVKDGGYVSLTVSPQDFIGIFYVSGCRPTDGTTTPSPSLTPKKTWSGYETTTHSGTNKG